MKLHICMFGMFHSSGIKNIEVYTRPKGTCNLQQQPAGEVYLPISQMKALAPYLVCIKMQVVPSGWRDV